MPPFVGVWNPRQRVGAHRDPDQEISEQRRQMQPAKQHHDEHGARQQNQHQLKRVAHPEVLVFVGARGKRRRFGLVYSRTYDKGCSRRGPARFLSMNDRSKKAISTSALELARKVRSIQDDAVSGLISRLDERFLDALGLILACRGRVVVGGVGKSGHIARKIASTLASTGTPAFFVHAAEAGHGDLGMITTDDVIVALSWSGEQPEMKNLVNYSARFAIPMIAVTANADSSLGAAARIVLELPKAREACPHNLAPTTSTLMQAAIGDALAIALLESRGFTALEFANFHPGGKLGAMLKHTSDLMHTGDELPLTPLGTRMSDALVEMSAKSFGCVAIVDSRGAIAGIITD